MSEITANDIHDRTQGAATEADVAAAKAWLDGDVVTVTCSSCSHDAQIMAHLIDGHEQRWQCDCAVSYVTVNGEQQPTKASGLCDCSASNVLEGLPGIPGEGTLNPAATAMDDGALIEAAVRKGLVDEASLDDGKRGLLAAFRASRAGGGTIHDVAIGGTAGSSGEATGGTV